MRWFGVVDRKWIGRRRRGGGGSDEALFINHLEVEAKASKTNQEIFPLFFVHVRATSVAQTEMILRSESRSNFSWRGMLYDKLWVSIVSTRRLTRNAVKNNCQWWIADIRKQSHAEIDVAGSGRDK